VLVGATTCNWIRIEKEEEIVGEGMVRDESWTRSAEGR
jgi:hypothetical protein